MKIRTFVSRNVALFLPMMFIAVAFAGARAETTPLWRFTTTSDISYFRLVSLDPPRLVVATKDALLFVDAITGKVLWSRADLRNVPAVHFDVMDAGSANPIPLGRGIVLVDGVMQIFDLETGARLSESGNWQVKKVSGYLPVYGDALVLVLAKTARGNSALLGVELRSGAVRWRREDIFKQQPKMYQAQIGTRGLLDLYTETLFGNQPPLQVDSANLLLYLSEDGPVDIDPATGKTVWSGAVVKKKEVPGIADGYAPILVEQGVAFVPSGDTLVALKATDGTPLWPSAPQLPGRIVQMEWTARGLLVAGTKADSNGNRWDPFLALLNPATGGFRWQDRVIDLNDPTPFAVQGDTAYVAVKKKLVAVDLAKGFVRDIATVTFEGREQPKDVEVRPDGVLLISAHNLLSLGADGSPKYRRYYPGPEVRVSFLAALRSVVLHKRISLPVTVRDRDFVYIFTTAPDPSGHGGLSLVRVNTADGSEAGRVWLTEQSFDYETDPATDVVYLKQDSKQIVALRFDVGTAPVQAPER